MPATSAKPFPARAGTARNRGLEHAVQSDPGSFRILTGDRPTGPLHIGHLFGTLENRVRLQELGVELLVLIADYQTITDRVAPVRLPHDVEGLVADYLAVGIDPDRAIIFTHSQVPELNQLILPFLSLISVAELGRNPTVKDEIAMIGGGSTSALMFTYPAHQAADILFCHANLVPVGKDQLPHLELTRTIARRFNERYSPDAPYFPEPEALLSRAPLVRVRREMLEQARYIAEDHRRVVHRPDHVPREGIDGVVQRRVFVECRVGVPARALHRFHA